MKQNTEDVYKEFKHMLGSGALRILLNVKIGESTLDGLAEQLHRDNAQFNDNNVDIAKCYKFLKYQLNKFGLTGIQQIVDEKTDLTALFKFKFISQIEDSEVNFLIPDAWAILRLPNIEDRRKISYRIFSSCVKTGSVKLSDKIPNFNGFKENDGKFEWRESSGIKFLLYKDRMCEFNEYAADYLNNYYVAPYLKNAGETEKTVQILSIDQVMKGWKISPLSSNSHS
ncbi:hypothetical protein KO525_16610 [Psychrosphaera sp. B3R10]|uniref:hypothetical protein n=1 Tax=unclassified Psychrosphaera TaxID=2641570 RepID=UPI001C0915D1|nr:MULTISPECIES: hypothetical protein [unclassified Psychrosphaera]MBU2883658.1 hypothetical protein [Psychrosphaera sp. I2R16]MBU2991008.1 hypothetical protein [Psychrosphaera sp. B3R10]